MTEFLESLRNKVDGPKLPFHLDRHPVERDNKWCVKQDLPGGGLRTIDTHLGKVLADNNPPPLTIKQAEELRDSLNKSFRDEGAGGESLSSTS